MSTTDGWLPLIVGTILAIVALIIVLAPLVQRDGNAADGTQVSPDPSTSMTVSRTSPSLDDAVEAAIARAKAAHHECVTCGPRPEADALYCSNCGRYLPGVCGRCGAPVVQPSSRFCTNCGEQLTA